MFYAVQGRLNYNFLQNVRSSSSSQELNARPTQDCAKKNLEKTEPESLSTSNQSLSRKSSEEETGIRFKLVVTTTDNKIATTVSVLYNDEGYPANLPEFPFPAIDRCACGSEKPYSSRKATRCLNCTNYVCMIKGCETWSSRMQNITDHQRRDHTDEELKKYVLYRFTHCICGEIRKRKPGVSTQTCATCSRILCSMGECFAITYESRDHLKRLCWFVESDYKDKCKSCKTPKVRDGETVAAKCPKEGCPKFWCLCYSCPFESEFIEGVHLHQGMSHLTFLREIV